MGNEQTTGPVWGKSQTENAGPAITCGFLSRFVLPRHLVMAITSLSGPSELRLTLIKKTLLCVRVLVSFQPNQPLSINVKKRDFCARALPARVDRF